MGRWLTPRTNATSSVRNRFCRMPSTPTSGRRLRSGVGRRACRAIRGKHSLKAATSNGSRKNAAPGTRRVSPPMPDSGRPHLAFDLGAESGRALLGRVRAGAISVEEIRRFPNEPVADGGSLRWDAGRLWLEMRKAISVVEDEPLAGIGVDAWGVDYALLG